MYKNGCIQDREVKNDWVEILIKESINQPLKGGLFANLERVYGINYPGLNLERVYGINYTGLN